jgi:hypothetical protein
MIRIDPVKKKQVSYDDILASLNMKVVDGKLQYFRNFPQEPQPQQPQQYNPRNQVQLPTGSQFSKNSIKPIQYNANINNNIKKNLNPFNNLYTKNNIQIIQEEDEGDELQPDQQNAQSPTQIPSPEMILKRRRELAIYHYLKKIDEMNRINEIKSTKMVYSTNQQYIRTSPYVNMNRLFKLKK